VRNASQSFYAYAMSRARIIAKNKNTYIIHIFPYNNTHFLLLCVRLYYMLFACVRACVLIYYMYCDSRCLYMHTAVAMASRSNFSSAFVFFCSNHVCILYNVNIHSTGHMIFENKSKMVKKNVHTTAHIHRTQTDRPTVYLKN